MGTINVLSKNKNNITIFNLKTIFFSDEKLQYFTWACFRNDGDSVHNTASMALSGCILFSYKIFSHELTFQEALYANTNISICLQRLIQSHSFLYLQTATKYLLDQ